MTVQARDALSGASLLSATRAEHGACQRCASGAARASRTKSEISCSHGNFLCFGLDPSSLLLRRVKTQALRGNTKTFPACRSSFGRKPSLRPNKPRLEARLHRKAGRVTVDPVVQPWRRWRLHHPFLSYCPATVLSANDTVSRLSAFPCRVAGSAKGSPRSGLTFAQFGFGLFRSRNTKILAALVILRFIRRMETADNAESKLCALITRHTQDRRITSACLRPTWQEEGQALSVASSPVRRKRRVETVPVSTPFGIRRGGASRSWRLRP